MEGGWGGEIEEKVRVESAEGCGRIALLRRVEVGRLRPQIFVAV